MSASKSQKGLKIIPKFQVRQIVNQVCHLGDVKSVCAKSHKMITLFEKKTSNFIM